MYGSEVSIPAKEHVYLKTEGCRTFTLHSWMIIQLMNTKRQTIWDLFVNSIFAKNIRITSLSYQ